MYFFIFLFSYNLWLFSFSFKQFSLSLCLFMACTFHVTATDLQFYTGVLLHILIDVLPFLALVLFLEIQVVFFFFPFIFWLFPHSWYFLSLTHSNCSMGLSLISRGFSPGVLHHFALIWTGCFQDLLWSCSPGPFTHFFPGCWFTIFQVSYILLCHFLLY